MNNLSNLVHELARAQADKDAVTAQVSAMIEAVQQLPDYIKLKEQKINLEGLIDNLTEEIKAAGLAAYADTESKRPHPAVGIRIKTKVTYDEKEALAYCMEHLTPAVRLNTKVFEDLAKKTPLPVATVYYEPSVTISPDLSEWLNSPDELVPADQPDGGE